MILSYAWVARSFVPYLSLRHDHCSARSVKLRPSCPAYHLQASAAVVFLVACGFTGVTGPSPRTLDDDKMRLHRRKGCGLVYVGHENRCQKGQTRSSDTLHAYCGYRRYISRASKQVKIGTWVYKQVQLAYQARLQLQACLSGCSIQACSM